MTKKVRTNKQDTKQNRTTKRQGPLIELSEDLVKCKGESRKKAVDPVSQEATRQRLLEMEKDLPGEHRMIYNFAKQIVYADGSKENHLGNNPINPMNFVINVEIAISIYEQCYNNHIGILLRMNVPRIAEIVTSPEFAKEVAQIMESVEVKRGNRGDN